MQNDNQQKPELDADILQCKMDLQRALQAAKRVPPQVVKPSESPADSPVQSSESLQSGNSEQDVKSPEELFGRLDGKILRLEEAIETEKQTRARLVLETEELRKTLAARESDAERLTADLDAKNESLDKTMRHLAQTKQRLSALPDEHRRQMAVLEGQVQGKTTQLNELAEQNRHLQERLDASVQSADSQRVRIEELECELAEKIGQITTLKQAIEERTSSLALQAQQLRQTGEEKESIEKQLETKTAEWAQALETLKTAQASAMQALSERQRQLETICEDLSDAESRLEQANSTNAMLSRENVELLETLEQARHEAADRYEAVVSEFDDEDQGTGDFETRSLEPYCEPVAEEISEDDVHLEQKLTDESIPAFNLAEQIMAEQRKASANRRQGPGSGREKTTPNGSIEHVLRHYVSNGQTPAPPGKPADAPQPRPADPTNRFLRWQGENLSVYQESLLSAIIQRDIRHFCGRDVPVSALHRPMDN